MSLTSELSGILEKYAGGGSANAGAQQGAHEDFQQVASSVPKDVTASGIEQAINSDQTPPFPQIVARLFQHADSNGRAGLLNRLLQSAGGSGAVASLPGLAAISRLFGGNQQQVAPDQAAQIPPQEVEQLAAHAQSQNPQAVKGISQFAAEHPNLLKALEVGFMAVALRHISRRI